MGFWADFRVDEQKKARQKAGLVTRSNRLCKVFDQSALGFGIDLVNAITVVGMV